MDYTNLLLTMNDLKKEKNITRGPILFSNSKYMKRKDIKADYPYNQSSTGTIT